MHKFSIITPCYNSEKFISETIDSVINQSIIQKGLADLEYIIIDGGSTDKTIEIIDKKFSCINNANITTKILTESDNGMYDAIAKGLLIVTGDITAYLNSDDFYSPYAFEIVNQIFSQYNEIKWLQGSIVFYNIHSQIIRFIDPFRYKNRLIQKGMYGIGILPFIQQESIFWRSELNSAINLCELRKYKYAGDYYLWKTFSKVTKLHIVWAYLSGFRVHTQNLTQTIGKSYDDEFISIQDRATFIDYIISFYEKIFWSGPQNMKKRINKKILKYNVEKDSYLY